MFDRDAVECPKKGYPHIQIPSAVAKMDLPWSTKAVYGFLYTLGGITGHVYPSKSHIAGQLGMSKSTVHRCVTDLIKSNLLLVYRPSAKASYMDRKRNTYIVKSPLDARAISYEEYTEDKMAASSKLVPLLVSKRHTNNNNSRKQEKLARASSSSVAIPTYLDRDSSDVGEAAQRMDRPDPTPPVVLDEKQAQIWKELEEDSSYFWSIVERNLVSVRYTSKKEFPQLDKGFIGTYANGRSFLILAGYRTPYTASGPTESITENS